MATASHHFGVSGIIYALMAAGLLELWRRDRWRPPWWVWLLSAVLVTRIVVETWLGTLVTPFHESDAVPPVPLAHLIGALCGVACVLPRRFGWVVPACLLMVPATASAAARPVVAVQSVDARRAGLSRHQLVAMRQLVAARLTASGAYRVAPRGRDRRALVDQRRRSYGPTYDRSSRVRLDRDRAARKSVGTRILRVGRRCHVTVTLYDLETTTAERAGAAVGSCRVGAVTASLRVALAALVPIPRCLPATRPPVGGAHETRMRRGPRSGLSGPGLAPPGGAWRQT